jgi:adenine nucleotide transporter 17
MTTKRLGSEDDDKKKSEKLSAFGTLSKIISEDGVYALWQGIIPALVLVINPIIQYTAFEKMKAVLLKRKKSLTNADFFILGALSKLAATGITYPYM